jgi:hypothetical protein
VQRTAKGQQLVAMLVLYWSQQSQVSPEVPRAAGAGARVLLCRFNGAGPSLSKD